MTNVFPSKTATLNSSLARWRRWVILAMLLSLHAGLISPAGGDFQRIWLTVHFGLFLLWQPFISTARELNMFATTLFFVITGVVIFSLSGWMMMTWVAILIAIMGGKVFTQQAARRGRFYLVAVFYLFTVLLLWAVPVLLLNIKSLPDGLPTLVKISLPIVLLTMAVLPYRAEDEASAQVFDFFYSLFIFQLVVVLVLGSLAAMRVTDNSYFSAVLLTVLSFSGALLILAALWAPRVGYGGLRTYFSRYLMSVGMPFELWMRRIAALSEADMTSARFLQTAMVEVATMPWVFGCKLTAPDGNGEFGTATRHSAQFRYHELDVTFHTESQLSPALFLHLRLLAQVVGEFYEGKRREQFIKQNAYMQAVHETGAKLTHDVKNLLQSLYALTSKSTVRQRGAGPQDERRTPTPYEAMLDRQLPQLTKRLQTTLDKLQNPALGSTGILLPAEDWWNDVVARHAGSGASFAARGSMAATVPVNLFDTVLENCLENSRKKKQREPDIAVSIALSTGSSADAEVVLTIADTGSAIPSAAVDSLFNAPVANSRGGGLGIGLYQAYKQAEQAGYLLSLTANTAGDVQFALKRAHHTSE
ncbi:MAG: hypothetical protein LH481_06965 [Burkholderiales bacterium]|nr:hypothetical protein [Burkholderiales bacterium]